MYRFKNNSLRLLKVRPAFTIVEVVAALALLGIMLSSVLVLMNRYVDAVIDMQLREQAFELARGNMEQLLSENKLSDMAEFGTSQTNPDIEWQTVVEPFYEPVTDQMWIRAVCSAGFTDTEGESQEVKLEHWITNLTPEQIKQILAQQELESEWMKLLKSGEYSDIQKTTIYCLEQQSLNVGSYKKFLEEQRREKMEYLDKNGTDGWEDFLQEKQDEENEFLEYEIGMDFDLYNECAAEYNAKYPENPNGPTTGPGPIIKPKETEPPCIDCTGFPQELIDFIRTVLDIPCC